MDKKKQETLLDKVREFFTANDVDAEVVVTAEKFETVLLADGVTEVTIEPAVEVGSAIVLTAEDGNPIPAPASEYELQDGRTVVVVEDGVIAEVREPEVVEDEVVEEEVLATDEPAEAQRVKKIIERIESEKIFEKVAELESLKQALEAEQELTKFLKAENETLTDQFTEMKQFTKEAFEALLAEPSKEPIQAKVNPLKAFRNENDAIADFLNKHNK